MAEKQMDCPSCGKKKHLYLNIEKQLFHCFRCGYSGRAKDLEMQGIAVPKKTDELLKPSSLSFRVAEGMSDPPEYWDAGDDTIDYLADRGVHVTIQKLLRKKIYETSRGILFFYPDRDYWQVRHWSAWAPPRWLNPTVAPVTPAGGVVFHLRTHYDSDRVVLVEGIVDALRVAPFANVAAVLSTNIHEAQISGLAANYESCSIMLDRDVHLSKLLAQGRKVGAYFKHKHLVKYRSVDPGSASDEEIEEALHAHD